MGVKRSRDFVLTIEDDDVVSQSESDTEELPNDNKKRKTDEDINPDFEFDGFDMLEGVKEIDDDGWGFGGVTGMRTGAQVDLDGIIARRRENLNDDEEEEEEEEEEAEAEDNEKELADGSDDENSGDEEFNGFEDDDEIAEDGFGMGADDEGEEVEGSDEERISNDEDDDELKDGAEDAAEDDASDSNSVASYQPHPDDLASDSDSDDVQEDAEEIARKAAYFASAEDDIPTDEVQPFMTMALTRPTLKALAAMNFDLPTQIQARTIPIALQGKDIVGSAVTGSGKTAAFMIPILERLSYRSRSIAKTRVLVLTPTRELAMQCFDVATKLARFTDVKFTLIVGGLSVKSQETELRKGPDVVIATPGRFIDHVRNSQGFVPDGIEILVIDEADRMLEDGFRDELTEITESLPKSRQTMLFSATMTDDVNTLIRLSLTKPVRLFVDPKNSTVAGLTQEFIRIRPQRETLRPAMLVELCRSFFTKRVIVFFRSKAFAHRMRIVFGLLNMKAGELHGSLSQEQRMASLESFRKQEVDFLLCTDLASRGLDIRGIDTVINYEAPASYEIYLHRVGRTARAGRIGRAITLAGEADRKIVKTALKKVKESGKVVSRILPAENVNALGEKLEQLEDEIEAVLQEEKEEKAMKIAEMEVRKGENVMRYQDEIMARPKRTWFSTEKEKAIAKEKSKPVYENALPHSKKPKNKKKVDDEPMGRLYKKTKTERGIKFNKRDKSTKGKPKSGGVRKPKGKPSKRR